MKYVTFAIMAVLIFGVATAPVFSNGVVFAQTEKEVAIEKKNNTAAKKEVSTEKKQISKDKKAVIAEKKQISKEKRLANNELRKAQLLERFANMPEERKQTLQDRLDAMKERHTNSTQPRMHLNPEEIQEKLQEIRDKRSAMRETQKNMTPEERQAIIDALLAVVKEKRENIVSPRDQLGLGLAPEDIICAEDKELVIRVSNGMPTCLGSDSVLVLMDRGIIAYPE